MTFMLRDRVSTADTEYGIVLLDEDNGEYWNLNPTGALVVRVLLDGGDAADAARLLTEQYGVDDRTARSDVEDLLDGLHASGLITERPAPRRMP